MKSTCEEAIFFCQHCAMNFPETVELDTFTAKCPTCGKFAARNTLSAGVSDNTRKPPKHRKDTTKPPLSMVNGDFLAAMACNMRDGVRDGRNRDDWMRIEWDSETRAHYMDALLRHAHIDFDPIAVACNAMIIWYNDRKMKRQDKDYNE